ncbi:MAG: arsenic resistance N-acetyltransferase ArsN2 [Gemmatimonadaceae bacterium]
MTTVVGPATIRHATRDDCAAIERLLTEAGLPTAGVAEILEDRAQDFFVAESSAAPGRVVAVAGLEVCCNDALLRSVAVQSEWRDHGVGRDLVRRVVCHAEERGIRAVYLLTMTAEHYFPRFGFEPVERFAVPREIAETLEFKSACPATAVAMRRAATNAAK